MNISRTLSAVSALLLTASTVTAQAQDGGWVSYRDAYRSMVVFEKYGKPKHLIQSHVQVMPKDKVNALDGVQLTLKGKATELHLPLDAAGRAVFPLLKAAYDENAALVLNRPAGLYSFRRRVSIVARPDGIYDSAELRAACEQAQGFQRYVDRSASGKCVGARFAFSSRQGEPAVRLRRADGSVVALAVVNGAPYADDPNDSFRVVNYRFGEAGQVLTQGMPVTIAPLIE